MLSLTNITQKPESCSSCPYRNIGVGFSPSWIPPNPKIAVMTNAPDDVEISEREPFVGAYGRMFMRVSEKAGFTRGDILIASSIACHTPNTFYPIGQMRKDAERACRWQDAIQNRDLAPGGLDAYNPDTYLISYHPVDVSKKWTLKRIFENDIIKARRLSDRGMRVLILLGEKPMNLVTPWLNGGVTKWRGSYGKLDWSEFKGRFSS